MHSSEAATRRHEQIIAISAVLHQEVMTMLSSAHGFESRFGYDENDTISKQRLSEAVKYALRDLDRLEDEQVSGPSVTKFLGYIGFWFAKLKPIVEVDILRSGAVDDDEIVDINEKIVLPLLRRMLIRMTREGGKTDLPKIWLNCTNAKCTDSGAVRTGSCFQKKFLAYLNANGGKYHDYVHYTLRYRDSSPYMLVALLDQAIYFSCEALVPALYS